MRVKAYSIYDVKAAMFQRPFFAVADGAAMRAFGDLAIDKTHDVGKHPGDYSLYHLGSFDDNNGKVIGSTPLELITGLEAAGSNEQG